MMRTKEQYRYPTALTIAGSDSCGGAGIQADLKTFSALGVYGMSAITSITAQNTLGVRGIQPILPEILKGQIDAVFEDFTIDAVKTGMLYNKAAIQVVAAALDQHRPKWIIVDPVMISTSGSKLLQDDAIEAMVDLLFPRTTLITPNIPEAEFLTGIQIHSVKDIDEAAQLLFAKGCQAVLIKGGHLEGEQRIDRLYQLNQPAVTFQAETVQTVNTHGTGCTLSSAIAASLALGHSLTESVRLAKEYVQKGLLAGADVTAGHGHGPMNHLFDPKPLQKRVIES